jgi:hypothetical protein
LLQAEEPKEHWVSGTQAIDAMDFRNLSWTVTPFEEILHAYITLEF